jgi:hypothetical protein
MMGFTSMANNMQYKSTLIIVITALLIFQGNAHAVPTKWEAVKLSMSELINSGWQISAHGTNRIAANSSTANSFDVSTFSFLLTKNGDYIICIAQDPKPPVANSVSCRKLN